MGSRLDAPIFTLNFYTAIFPKSLASLKNDNVTRTMPIYKPAIDPLIHLLHVGRHVVSLTQGMDW